MNKQVNLSEHFTLAELTKTSVKIGLAGATEEKVE